MPFRPAPIFEVNFEDDPLRAHPGYLNETAPIGFWRMEATSGTTEQDVTANNRDLTYVNAPTLGAAGAYQDTWVDINPAVQFNGTDESANTATAAAWQNLTAAWSLAAWIYPTASRSGSNAGSGIIMGTRPSGTPIPFMLCYGAFGAAGIGDVVWGGFLDSGGALRHTKDTAAPTLNTWAHYACTWDGTTITLYKNGVIVGTPNVPGVAANAAAANIALQLALTPVGVTLPYFPGRIDEPAVWDRALSQVEVTNLVRYHTVNTVTPGNYIDLSSRLRETADVSFGRSDAVSSVEASTGTVVLQNQDGALFPDPIVNLLPNPSAEYTLEAGYPFVGEGGTVTYDTTHVRARLYAFKLTTTTAAQAYASTKRDGLVGLRPGETYTFSGYPYVATGGGIALADVTFDIVDIAGGSTTVTSSGNPPALDIMTNRISVTRTIPANATAAWVRVKANSGGVAGRTIWFDDMQLEQAGSASTYCDGEQTDCRWGGEPHRSLSHRKVSGSWRKIIPMRRFRLGCIWDSVTYWLLQGYVESFSYPPLIGLKAECVMRLTDGTRILAVQPMSGFTRPSERAGVRLRAILEFAGIGEDDYDVQDELIEGLAVTAESVASTDTTTALALIREIEETEGGIFFFSREGKFTYQGSLARSLENPETFLITTSDTTATDIPYSDMSAHLDVAAVVNQTVIDNDIGGTDIYIEPESQRRYFPIVRSELSKWQTDVTSYMDRSVPMPYASGIEVFAENDPDRLWPMILPLEISDMGRVEFVQNGRDLFAGHLQFLEGMRYRIGGTQTPWGIQLLTTPRLINYTTPDPWQTPIAKPIFLTNVFSGSGGSSVVIPSRLWTAGKLYMVFCSLHATGGTAPVAPTFSGSNTWTSIRADTGVSSVSWRHTTFRTLATATATEAVTLSFAGQTPNNLYDVVLLEISDGFHATPIGVSNQHTVISAFSGFVDVGTLTDNRSIVLAGVWKNANVDTAWSGGIELYDRASNNNSYSVSYSTVPGVDRIDFSWSQANGYHGTGFEVKGT